MIPSHVFLQRILAGAHDTHGRDDQGISGVHGTRPPAAAETPLQLSDPQCAQTHKPGREGKEGKSTQRGKLNAHVISSVSQESIRKAHDSIDTDRRLALLALPRPPKEPVTTGRTVVSLLLSSDPCRRAVGSPVGNRAQYHLLARGHREPLDQGAGKLGTLMATLNSLLPRAVPDGALLAEGESASGQTAIAQQILRGQAGKLGKAPGVDPGESFQVCEVVLLRGVVDPAHAAVEPARSNLLSMDLGHVPLLPYCLAVCVQAQLQRGRQPRRIVKQCPCPPASAIVSAESLSTITVD